METSLLDDLIGSQLGANGDSDRPFTIYFAGGLFTHKELIGNAILAHYIQKVSCGRYRCILPQDLEQTVNRASHVRNQDLLQVMQRDLAIFNFDGPELDSGTVVEFVFAKMLDIPSVVLRTDFRGGGDGFKDGDPWNLMCSSYPRTQVLLVHAMAEYQTALHQGGTKDQIEERFYTKLAHQMVENLDAVRQRPSWFSEDINLQEAYRIALRFPGAGLETTRNSFLRAVLRRKIARGLLPASRQGFIPNKAQQVYATLMRLRAMAKELQQANPPLSDQELLLSVSTTERCNDLLSAVLELDRIFGESLELHQEIFQNQAADGTSMLAAVAGSIREKAAGLQHSAEDLYRQVAFHARAVFQKPQVTVQEALLRTFTLEVQQVANVIAERAESEASTAQAAF